MSGDDAHKRRRKTAIARADEARRDARYHDRQAKAAVARAETIERTWEIPAPCEGTTSYCGKRGCSEH